MSRDEKKIEHGQRLCRHGNIDEYILRLKEQDPDYQKHVDYRNLWAQTLSLEAASGMNLDKPLHVSFELVDNCNLRCSFCYRKGKEHSNTRLSRENLGAALKEIREAKIPAIDFSISEPLIHPDICSMIEMAGEAGLQEFIITTNGLKLSPDVVKVLFGNVSRLHVSVDATQPETYRKIRGGDLKKLEKNIDSFLDMREKNNTRFPVLRLSFIMLDANKEERMEFAERWYDRVDYIDFQDYVSFAYVDSLRTIAPRHDLFCPGVFRYLTVKADGNIYPCDTFYSKYYCIGNIHEQGSLLKAWNSDLARQVRSSFMKRQYKLPCVNCLCSTEQ